MQSIFEQSFKCYEYIVIDGGSTDGSKEYIRKHANQLAYWVSEKDRGIYDAMNKGLSLAKGEYVQFINSGDQLANSKTLFQVAEIITKNVSIDFFFSDVINASNKKIHSYPKVLTLRYFLDYTINHQSTIFKIELFEKYGFYSQSYKIVSDWEFYLKILFFHQCSYNYISEPLVIFDFENGISTSRESELLIGKEREIVLKKMFPHILPDYNTINQILNSRSWKFLVFINKIRKKLQIWKKLQLL